MFKAIKQRKAAAADPVLVPQSPEEFLRSLRAKYKMGKFAEPEPTSPIAAPLSSQLAEGKKPLIDERFLQDAKAVALVRSR